MPSSKFLKVKKSSSESNVSSGKGSKDKKSLSVTSLATQSQATLSSKDPNTITSSFQSDFDTRQSISSLSTSVCAEEILENTELTSPNLENELSFNNFSVSKDQDLVNPQTPSAVTDTERKENTELPEFSLSSGNGREVSFEEDNEKSFRLEESYCTDQEMSNISVKKENSIDQSSIEEHESPQLSPKETEEIKVFSPMENKSINDSEVLNDISLSIHQDKLNKSPKSSTPRTSPKTRKQEEKDAVVPDVSSEMDNPPQSSFYLPDNITKPEECKGDVHLDIKADESNLATSCISDTSYVFSHASTNKMTATYSEEMFSSSTRGEQRQMDISLGKSKSRECSALDTTDPSFPKTKKQKYLSETDEISGEDQHEKQSVSEMISSKNTSFCETSSCEIKTIDYTSDVDTSLTHKTEVRTSSSETVVSHFNQDLSHDLKRKMIPEITQRDRQDSDTETQDKRMRYCSMSSEGTDSTITPGSSVTSENSFTKPDHGIVSPGHKNLLQDIESEIKECKQTLIKVVQALEKDVPCGVEGASPTARMLELLKESHNLLIEGEEGVLGRSETGKENQVTPSSALAEEVPVSSLDQEEDPGQIKATHTENSGNSNSVLGSEIGTNKTGSLEEENYAKVSNVSLGDGGRKDSVPLSENGNRDLQRKSGHEEARTEEAVKVEDDTVSSLSHITEVKTHQVEEQDLKKEKSESVEFSEEDQKSKAKKQQEQSHDILQSIDNLTSERKENVTVNEEGSSNENPEESTYKEENKDFSEVEKTETFPHSSRNSQEALTDGDNNSLYLKDSSNEILLNAEDVVPLMTPSDTELQGRGISESKTDVPKYIAKNSNNTDEYEEKFFSAETDEVLPKHSEGTVADITSTSTQENNNIQTSSEKLKEVTIMGSNSFEHIESEKSLDRGSGITSNTDNDGEERTSLIQEDYDIIQGGSHMNGDAVFKLPHDDFEASDNAKSEKEQGNEGWEAVAGKYEAGEQQDALSSCEDFDKLSYTKSCDKLIRSGSNGSPSSYVHVSQLDASDVNSKLLKEDVSPENKSPADSIITNNPDKSLEDSAQGKTVLDYDESVTVQNEESLSLQADKIKAHGIDVAIDSNQGNASISECNRGEVGVACEQTAQDNHIQSGPNESLCHSEANKGTTATNDAIDGNAIGYEDYSINRNNVQEGYIEQSESCLSEGISSEGTLGRPSISLQIDDLDQPNSLAVNSTEAERRLPSQSNSFQEVKSEEPVGGVLESSPCSSRQDNKGDTVSSVSVHSEDNTASEELLPQADKIYEGRDDLSDNNVVINVRAANLQCHENENDAPVVPRELDVSEENKMFGGKENGHVIENATSSDVEATESDKQFLQTKLNDGDEESMMINESSEANVATTIDTLAGSTSPQCTKMAESNVKEKGSEGDPDKPIDCVTTALCTNTEVIEPSDVKGALQDKAKENIQSGLQEIQSDIDSNIQSRDGMVQTGEKAQRGYSTEVGVADELVQNRSIVAICNEIPQDAMAGQESECTESVQSGNGKIPQGSDDYSTFLLLSSNLDEPADEETMRVDVWEYDPTCSLECAQDTVNAGTGFNSPDMNSPDKSGQKNEKQNTETITESTDSAENSEAKEDFLLVSSNFEEPKDSETMSITISEFSPKNEPASWPERILSSESESCTPSFDPNESDLNVTAVPKGSSTPDHLHSAAKNMEEYLENIVVKFDSETFSTHSVEHTDDSTPAKAKLSDITGDDTSQSNVNILCPSDFLLVSSNFGEPNDSETFNVTISELGPNSFQESFEETDSLHDKSVVTAAPYSTDIAATRDEFASSNESCSGPDQLEVNLKSNDNNHEHCGKFEPDGTQEGEHILETGNEDTDETACFLLVSSNLNEQPDSENIRVSISEYSANYAPENSQEYTMPLEDNIFEHSISDGSQDVSEPADTKDQSKATTMFHPKGVKEIAAVNAAQRDMADGGNKGFCQPVMIDHYTDSSSIEKYDNCTNAEDSTDASEPNCFLLVSSNLEEPQDSETISVSITEYNSYLQDDSMQENRQRTESSAIKCPNKPSQVTVGFPEDEKHEIEVETGIFDQHIVNDIPTELGQESNQKYLMTDNTDGTTLAFNISPDNKDFTGNCAIPSIKESKHRTVPTTKSGTTAKKGVGDGSIESEAMSGNKGSKPVSVSEDHKQRENTNESSDNTSVFEPDFMATVLQVTHEPRPKETVVNELPQSDTAVEKTAQEEREVKNTQKENKDTAVAIQRKDLEDNVYHDGESSYLLLAHDEDEPVARDLLAVSITEYFPDDYLNQDLNVDLQQEHVPLKTVASSDKLVYGFPDNETIISGAIPNRTSQIKETGNGSNVGFPVTCNQSNLAKDIAADNLRKEGESQDIEKTTRAFIFEPNCMDEITSTMFNPASEREKPKSVRCKTNEDGNTNSVKSDASYSGNEENSVGAALMQKFKASDIADNECRSLRGYGREQTDLEQNIERGSKDIIAASLPRNIGMNVPAYGKTMNTSNGISAASSVPITDEHQDRRMREFMLIGKRHVPGRNFLDSLEQEKGVREGEESNHYLLLSSSLEEAKNSETISVSISEYDPHLGFEKSPETESGAAAAKKDFADVERAYYGFVEQKHFTKNDARSFLVRRDSLEESPKGVEGTDWSEQDETIASQGEREEDDTGSCVKEVGNVDTNKDSCNALDDSSEHTEDNTTYLLLSSNLDERNDSDVISVNIFEYDIADGKESEQDIDEEQKNESQTSCNNAIEKEQYEMETEPQQTRNDRIEFSGNWYEDVHQKQSPEAFSEYTSVSRKRSLGNTNYCNKYEDDTTNIDQNFTAQNQPMAETQFDCQSSMDDPSHVLLLTSNVIEPYSSKRLSVSIVKPSLDALGNASETGNLQFTPQPTPMGGSPGLYGSPGPVIHTLHINNYLPSGARESGFAADSEEMSCQEKTGDTEQVSENGSINVTQVPENETSLENHEGPQLSTQIHPKAQDLRLGDRKEENNKATEIRSTEEINETCESLETNFEANSPVQETDSFQGQENGQEDLPVECRTANTEDSNLNKRSDSTSISPDGDLKEQSHIADLYSNKSSVSISEPVTDSEKIITTAISDTLDDEECVPNNAKTDNSGRDPNENIEADGLNTERSDNPDSEKEVIESFADEAATHTDSNANQPLYRIIEFDFSHSIAKIDKLPTSLNSQTSDTPLPKSVQTVDSEVAVVDDSSPLDLLATTRNNKPQDINRESNLTCQNLVYSGNHGDAVKDRWLEVKVGTSSMMDMEKENDGLGMANCKVESAEYEIVFIEEAARSFPVIGQRKLITVDVVERTPVLKQGRPEVVSCLWSNEAEISESEQAESDVVISPRDPVESTTPTENCSVSLESITKANNSQNLFETEMGTNIGNTKDTHLNEDVYHSEQEGQRIVKESEQQIYIEQQDHTINSSVTQADTTMPSWNSNADLESNSNTNDSPKPKETKQGDARIVLTPEELKRGTELTVKFKMLNENTETDGASYVQSEHSQVWKCPIPKHPDALEDWVLVNCTDSEVKKFIEVIHSNTEYYDKTGTGDPCCSAM